LIASGAFSAAIERDAGARLPSSKMEPRMALRRDKSCITGSTKDANIKLSE
jgi:hypothetical protein